MLPPELIFPETLPVVLNRDCARNAAFPNEVSETIQETVYNPHKNHVLFLSLDFTLILIILRFYGVYSEYL